MCVISYSPANVAIPDEATIKKMFTKNPDGAGFAIDKGEGIVEFHKGFMKVEDLIEALDKYDDLKAPAVTIHFRIGTHGKNNKATTHPFIIDSDFGKLRQLHGIGKFNVLFHNGTITDFGGILSPLSSDTQDFVAGPAFLLMNNKKKISKIKQKMFERILGSSRALIMRGNNQPEMYSAWTEHTDKCWYSNMVWNTAPSTAFSPSYQGSYPYRDDGTRKTSSPKALSPSSTANRTVPNWGASSSSVSESKREKTERKPITTDKDGKTTGDGVWVGKDRHWVEFTSEEARDRCLKTLSKTISKEDETYSVGWLAGMKYYKLGRYTIATETGLEKMLDLWEKEGLEDVDVREGQADGHLGFQNLEQLMLFTEMMDYDELNFTYQDEEGGEWIIDFSAMEILSRQCLTEFFGSANAALIPEMVANGISFDDAIEICEEDNDENEELTYEEQQNKELQEALIREIANDTSVQVA